MPTSYAEQAQGFAGMISDLASHTIETALNGEASAEIPFGYFVKQSAGRTEDGTPALAALPSNAADIMLGCVVHSNQYNRETDLGEDGILPDVTMGVMRKGRMYAYADAAVAVTDTPYIRITANSAKLPGMVTNGADSAKAVLFYGARFLCATTAAGPVEIEFDMNTYLSGTQTD